MLGGRLTLNRNRFGFCGIRQGEAGRFGMESENGGMPRLRRASAGVALTRPRATELVPAYCLSKTRISSSYRVWLPLPSVPVCLLVSVFPSAETVIRLPELTRP